MTYFNPFGRTLVVQDRTAGIYVSSISHELPPLHAGQLVDIEGFSAPGDFAPVIASPTTSTVAAAMNADFLKSSPPGG